MSRALTVKQPWASLIMAGVKDVENRRWPVPSTLPQWYACSGCDWRLREDFGWRNAPGITQRPEGVHVRENAGCGFVRPDGPFPFRLWVHAGKTRAHVWNDRQACEALARATHDEPYEPWMVAAAGALMPRGALLGSVLVTGCHHADECDKCRCGAEFGPPFCGADHDPQRRCCSPWAEPDTWHWTLTDPQPLPDDVAVPA